MRPGSIIFAFVLSVCVAGTTLHSFAADTAVQAVSAGNIFNECALLKATDSRRVFYADPVRGSMSNDGSSDAPWRSLEEIVKAGLIATQRYDVQPYKAGAGLRAQNPGGTVHAGDVILLRSGDHGAVVINGGINKEFITVSAEEGQTPILTRLSLSGSSKWIFRGLTIRNTKVVLVEFLDNNFFGPTDNIVFERNHLLSQEDVSTWTQKDWRVEGAAFGIRDFASCVTLRENSLRNLKFGIQVVGDKALVEGNRIDNFGDDGIDVVASDVVIRGNRITNNRDIGDKNHNDGIQGWTREGLTNRNILIEGNTIIASTERTLAFPGELQGISIFDGKWNNVRIVNNAVVANVWHGITLCGVENAMIVNNTVLGSSPKHATWIGIFNMKTGQSPADNVVRNNIAPVYNLKVAGITGNDHNLLATNPKKLFVGFDTENAQYDLRLSPDSRARGAGSTNGVPRTDILGAIRIPPVDIGAYAWSEARRP